MSEEKRSGWLAATCYPVGTLDDYTWSYNWDGCLHPTRRKAIRAGIEAFGSDDFNVGQAVDRALVWWGWMDEEHPAEDRVDAARALGLPLAPADTPEAHRD